MFPSNYNQARIRLVQRALNQMNYNHEGYIELKPDGKFGPQSIGQLKLWQASHGLPADGKYEDYTAAAIEAFMRENYLTEQDYRNVAQANNIEYALLRAIVEVESESGGVLPDGNPKTLFERHKFYQGVTRIKGKAVADKFFAKDSNICNPESGGYGAVNSQWGRLQRAIALAEGDVGLIDVAYESASWGVGQVMGFNHKIVGYATVGAFVADMMKGERYQLDAMVKFLLDNPKLVKAMKELDYATIAKFYNGSDYQRNSYDTKIRDARKQYV